MCWLFIVVLQTRPGNAQLKIGASRAERGWVLFSSEGGAEWWHGSPTCYCSSRSPQAAWGGARFAKPKTGVCVCVISVLCLVYCGVCVCACVRGIWRVRGFRGWLRGQAKRKPLFGVPYFDTFPHGNGNQSLNQSFKSGSYLRQPTKFMP